MKKIFFQWSESNILVDQNRTLLDIIEQSRTLSNKTVHNRTKPNKIEQLSVKIVQMYILKIKFKLVE